MNTRGLQIVKRDGKTESFSIDKIKNAIRKAFLSVGAFATEGDLTNILGRVHIDDDMSVEEIQNQVEIALMAEKYYTVAKSYMLYRQRHTEDREVRDKLSFLMNYCEAENAATGSKFDANANVENKNIATLIGELPKQNFIRLNRRLLTDRLKEMFGKEFADRYIELAYQSAFHLQKRRNESSQLLREHHHVSMVIEWHHLQCRRQFEGSYESEIFLWRIHQYGLYGV
jgi:anaerobic ribonucleoside-triphosphate reductase